MKVTFLNSQVIVTVPLEVKYLVLSLIRRWSPRHLHSRCHPHTQKPPQVKTISGSSKLSLQRNEIMSTPSQMRAARIVEVYLPNRFYLHLITNRLTNHMNCKPLLYQNPRGRISSLKSAQLLSVILMPLPSMVHGPFVNHVPDRTKEQGQLQN